jgi:hypothetical protein
MHQLPDDEELEVLFSPETLDNPRQASPTCQLLLRARERKT